MNDDAAFLAVIRATPEDNTARLAYADWLDEQGRSSGDFLRVDCEIATLDPVEFERSELQCAKLREESEKDSAPPETLDNYFWQRVHLVAKLRCTTRGLDDDWMAAVSRVPIDEINLRVREIQSWLQRRVTVAELLSKMAEWDNLTGPPRSLWQRVCGLLCRVTTSSATQIEGPHVSRMRKWVDDNLRHGDELWEYDSAGESWAQLCGEMGYAIIRNGKVAEFEMLMMN